MSESGAIVEKMPHRPGGCARIFFQLFDWNRRFAKKKLKKLLPPAQPKQCERKFGRDEKLPKLHLITNEKDGIGNNNSKQKPQMRSPSLVARLMGLESMPAVQKIKPCHENPVLETDNEGDKSTKTLNIFGFNLEKENGNEKHELRPHKAQKMDVFQFENLLSRPKKHPRPKLVSPLKNPKTSSRKTSSRLIDVASRILEPGLQNTNRAKSAITYSNNIRNANGNSNTFAMERKMAPISACKHCGNQLEKSDPNPNVEEKMAHFSSSILIYSNNIEEMKSGSIVPSIPSFEEENWRASERYQELSTLITDQAKYNKKSHRDSQSSIGLKHKTLRQSQVSMVSDREPCQRHGASSVANDFDHREKRTPTRFDYIVPNEKINSCNKIGGSLSRVRKRRSMSTIHNIESSHFSSSNNVNQRNARSNIVRRDMKGININSSTKQKMASGVALGKGYKSSSSGESDEKINAEKLLALSGDELGAILQKKLKEWGSQEDDERSTGSEPKRSTAVILQELISALTAEKAIIRDDAEVEYGGKIPCRSPQLPNEILVSVAKQKTARNLLSYLPEDEHPSPGSVLEASFSNDSCLSSNFGDGSEIYYYGELKPEQDPISHVSEVLLSLGFDNTALMHIKLPYAKDVILNMELISKNTTKNLSLLHFLIYEFENLATMMVAEFGPHKNEIKEFAFDCVIECIDTKYRRYASCGYGTWTKMPLCSIASDLVDEIRRWMGFGEYTLDEILDFEMSFSYGKWDDFGIEEYETGAEIGKDVLQILVDEIVVELFEGKVCSDRI